MKWLPKRVIGWRRGRQESPRFSPSHFGHSQFGTSRFGHSRFDASRSAAVRQRQASVRRWGMAGAVVGGLAALVAFAPASWLARAVASATDQRVQLAQAQGTLWNGQAVLVLTGGPGSRDAAALPGRLSWTLRPAGMALRLNLRQDCCINGQLGLVIQPGFGRTTVRLEPGNGWLAQWPSGLLGGMGTPWNTLQLGGAIRLSSSGLTLEQSAGRWQMRGRADIDILNASSPISTLEQLGNYRLSLFSNEQGQVQTSLTTRDGALQLNGEGQWGPGGVRFRGEARAREGSEAALNNLLNIIGRRDGARSVISIG